MDLEPKHTTLKAREILNKVYRKILYVRRQMYSM